MKCSSILAGLVLVSISCANADVYMHNPRGSNDRNCEKNANRQNANRLFDSQNNAAGGYACPKALYPLSQTTPKMYYYAGSEIKIEWTQQHACGTNPNSQCNMVIQYACEDTMPGIRDGEPQNENDAATATIPDDPNTSKEPQYGQHETYEYYQQCKTRDRNKGLYTADQNMNNRNKAKNTRQNNNGNRRGFECPEERDYYPYWHPSPWKDIAVITKNATEFCAMYTAESENVKGRGYCMDAVDATKYLQYNNEQECESKGGSWKVSKPHGGGAPDCIDNVNWGRDNHLGNNRLGEAPSYLWKIPDDLKASSCTLRLRYNISTGDYPWNQDASANGKKSMPSQDIYVDLLDDEGAQSKNILSNAINTNQFGRTFQDRSYVFEVKPRPADIPKDAKIHNLNVRGKRGNIVQTFPSVEYDFVPSIMTAEEDDYVHIQWAGSDYNPNRNPNDGDGKQNTDRHNMVQIETLEDNLPAVTADHFGLAQQGVSNGGKDGDGKVKPNTPGGDNQILVMDLTKQTFFDNDKATVEKFAFINQPTGNCLKKEDINNNNNNNNDKANQDENNCAKLNSAKYPMFDGGLKKLDKQGTFHYMSTRNNNFSNRSQKGTTVVTAKGATTRTANGYEREGFNAAGFPVDKNPNGAVDPVVAAAASVPIVLGLGAVGAYLGRTMA